MEELLLMTVDRERKVERFVFWYGTESNRMKKTPIRLIKRSEGSRPSVNHVVQVRGTSTKYFCTRTLVQIPGVKLLSECRPVTAHYCSRLFPHCTSTQAKYCVRGIRVVLYQTLVRLDIDLPLIRELLVFIRVTQQKDTHARFYISYYLFRVLHMHVYVSYICSIIHFVGDERATWLTGNLAQTVFYIIA